MNVSYYEEDVKRIFNENKLYYDWEVDPKNGHVEINVERGDWKHDHGFLIYLMHKNHYRLIDRNITEENGSDCFSAQYTFAYGS